MTTFCLAALQSFSSPFTMSLNKGFHCSPQLPIFFLDVPTIKILLDLCNKKDLDMLWNNKCFEFTWTVNLGPQKQFVSASQLKMLLGFYRIHNKSA